MTRRSGGSLAQQAGETFEQLLEHQHTMAVKLGLLAWVRHVAPKMKPTKVAGRLVWLPVGVACADFVGQLRDGRAYVVEAKSRQLKDGPLRLESDIAEHQREQLDACAANGGVAGLVVEFRAGLRKHRFAVPWTSVPWRTRRTAPGIDPGDLKGFEMGTDVYVRRLLEGR